MTSFSAKTEKPPANARQVLFVVYDDIVLLDLVGPLQVFSHAIDPATKAPGYRCAVASMRGGMVDTNTVVPIPTETLASYRGQPLHTLIIVGGDGANTAMHDHALVEMIISLHSGAQRVCSVCSGALVLAATGALDGRRAVTHWDDCATLRAAFPAVSVEVDPIYVKDGDVWTSAGITAGMDMALAVASEDLGRSAALSVARSMVTHMARSGGQSQFSPVLGNQLRDATGRFEDLHQWIAGNLTLPLTVESLAERMNMSARNFARLYASEIGLTPAKAVEAIRTHAARDLLETTDLSVKQVARRCGFNDEERMRRAFVRTLKLSPSDYRQGFRTS